MLPQTISEIPDPREGKIVTGRPEDWMRRSEETVSALLLGQTAIRETLDLLMAKLAEFEQRAEPLLRKAEQRGRLFGGAKSQNPMDRGV